MFKNLIELRKLSKTSSWDNGHPGGCVKLMEQEADDFVLFFSPSEFDVP